MQRALAVGLAFAAFLQAAGSIAQVNDKNLIDGQASEGIRSEAVDRVNAEGLKQLKGRADSLKADEQDVQRWREMKFGLFINWGPISLKGAPIGWSRGGERRGWRGTRLGPDYSSQFEPVTARYVRLNILQATKGPTIWEFQLFAPKK